MTDSMHAARDGLAALSEFCSNVEAGEQSAPTGALLDLTIRCCLLCVAIGTLEEASDLQDLAVLAPRPPYDLGQTMSAAVYQTALGAAADLDPMSPGPAHLALTATVAACCAGQLFDKTSDDEIASAVLAGIEAGSRLRQAVQGGRPGGAGFHSSGTFGTIAAAASTARLLNLPASQYANAIAIAFTRMSGLAVNAASTRICLTHFGWAAAHGIEAARLAASGWEASHNVTAALAAVFPGCTIDLTELDTVGDRLLFAPDAILFKRFPCNAYLNPVVVGLRDAGRDIDRIELSLPSIVHLDRPRPKDIREARYSAQAVAAISVLYPTVYRSFTDAVIDLTENSELLRMIDRVSLVMDKEAPTNLATASIGIRAWTRGRQVMESKQDLRQFTPWGLGHAADLLELNQKSWLTSLYGLPYASAYRLATDKMALLTES